MKTLDLIQGSPEWIAARSSYLCASEASAMLGLSPHLTRSELLRMKATGAEKEFSEWVKRNLLEKGHEVEALARPIAEEQIGEELYPATGVIDIDGLKLLASFDGITMMEDASWENKMFNQALADSVRAGELEPHYWAQLEHQLIVSGAERAYFTTSDGTKEGTIGLWYESVPERRAQVLAGWQQFVEDVANYQHVEIPIKPEAAPIMDLPALVVTVEGRVVSSNLAAFQKSASAFIQGIKTDLQTDQDFSDAENTVKFCKEGEERLELVKSQALAQTASIDELFRTIDLVSGELRAKRLELDRLVKQRKDSIRAEIVAAASKAYSEHIKALNDRLGKPYMPPINIDFAAAIKGKKTIATLRDAADTALANGKITANQIADKIQINLNSLRELAKDHAFLFADAAQLVQKDNADLVALVKARIVEHQQAEEARRIEAERKAAEEAARPAPAQIKAAAIANPPKSDPAQQARRAATVDGIDTPETILIAFIDAYESGSGIYTEKVYRRAKAVQERLGLPLAA